jgi:hypothetical protein
MKKSAIFLILILAALVVAKFTIGHYSKQSDLLKRNVTINPGDVTWVYFNPQKNQRRLLITYDESGETTIVVYNANTPRFAILHRADGTMATTSYTETSDTETQVFDFNGDGIPDSKQEADKKTGNSSSYKLSDIQWLKIYPTSSP